MVGTKEHHNKEREMDEFVVRFFPHYEKLSGDLRIATKALGVKNSEEELASVLDCDLDVARQLLSTQLRQLRPEVVEARRFEYLEALNRLAGDGGLPAVD